jgi:hypothetical protein
MLRFSLPGVRPAKGATTMFDTNFDHWARRLAARECRPSRSRTPTDPTADPWFESADSETCVQVGGTCERTDECCGEEMLCYQGVCDAPAICLGEEDPCRNSDGCCGALVCVQGICKETSDVEPVTTRAPELADADGYLVLGLTLAGPVTADPLDPVLAMRDSN